MTFTLQPNSMRPLREDEMVISSSQSEFLRKEILMAQRDEAPRLDAFLAKHTPPLRSTSVVTDACLSSGSPALSQLLRGHVPAIQLSAWTEEIEELQAISSALRRVKTP